MAEGTRSHTNNKALKKLDSIIQAQQTGIIENWEALSRLLVDIQQMFSKLDSLSTQVIIPHLTPHASPIYPIVGSTNTSFPPPTLIGNPPKAFKFSLLLFNNTSSHEWL